MSALEPCPTCSNPTSENATMCPSCGEPLMVGWADRIRAQRQADKNEAKRQQFLAYEAQERAERERELSRRHRRRIIFLLVAVAVITPILIIMLRPTYMSTFEPERWQAEQATKAEARRQRELEIQRLQEARRAEIAVLEKEVAGVPASDLEENIRLYARLVDLDPANERFKSKLDHYEDLKEKAAARAKEAERTAEQAREEADRQASAARKKTEEAAKRRKGFHCLSSWDGSHPDVKRAVKAALRDPESFDHVETRIAPVDETGRHVLFMTYRARNGFGGMNVESATASISNATCSATLLTLQ